MQRKTNANPEDSIQFIYFTSLYMWVSSSWHLWGCSYLKDSISIGVF